MPLNGSPEPTTIRPSARTAASTSIRGVDRVGGVDGTADTTHGFAGAGRASLVCCTDVLARPAVTIVARRIDTRAATRDLACSAVTARRVGGDDVASRVGHRSGSVASGIGIEGRVRIAAREHEEEHGGGHDEAAGRCHFARTVSDSTAGGRVTRSTRRRRRITAPDVGADRQSDVCARSDVRRRGERRFQRQSLARGLRPKIRRSAPSSGGAFTAYGTADVNHLAKLHATTDGRNASMTASTGIVE